MGPEEAIRQITDTWDPPIEGFEEYKKSCECLRPWLPSDCPEQCIGYRTPDGEVLHNIMLQPYFEAKKLSVRADDVLVASYPKTGTTWTQEISYLVAHDADFAKAKSKPVEERFPFIEIPIGGITAVQNWPEKRMIKTHLPYERLPPAFLENNTKIIYIARNPKDTVVSYYFFLKMLAYVSCNCTMKEFLDLFVEEKNMLYTSFADNVLGYWNRRHQENILFLTYEGLIKDLKGGVSQIAEFLGKSYSSEILEKIADHCSFNGMKSNAMANYSHGGACCKKDGAETDFLRKGKVGDWKNYFDEEMSQKIDRYVAEKFEGSGLEFEYELDG